MSQNQAPSPAPATSASAAAKATSCAALAVVFAAIGGIFTGNWWGSALGIAGIVLFVVALVLLVLAGVEIRRGQAQK